MSDAGVEAESPTLPGELAVIGAVAPETGVEDDPPARDGVEFVLITVVVVGVGKPNNMPSAPPATRAAPAAMVAQVRKYNPFSRNEANRRIG